MAPKGPNSFLYKHSHIHIKSKVMKRRIQWCKKFAPATCLGVTRDKKNRILGPVFDCHTTPPRRFELEP